MYFSEGLVCIGIYYVVFLFMFIGFVGMKAYDFYKRFQNNSKPIIAKEKESE